MRISLDKHVSILSKWEQIWIFSMVIEFYYDYEKPSSVTTTLLFLKHDNGPFYMYTMAHRRGITHTGHHT